MEYAEYIAVVSRLSMLNARTNRTDDEQIEYDMLSKVITDYEHSMIKNQQSHGGIRPPIPYSRNRHERRKNAKLKQSKSLLKPIHY